jgi:hypothetical protein
MTHQDRAYQEELENAVKDYLMNNDGNPVAVSPGGTGKSYVMARLIKWMVSYIPGTKVLQLAQDAKLLDQNSEELLRYWPTAPCGIYSAGLRKRDTHLPIIFAGIQSCAKRAADFGSVDVVIIDECDLVSPREETLYQKFINDLRVVNPGIRVVGFTATPYRLGTGLLTEAKMWDDICIDLTATERFNWFVEHGYLSRLVNKRACLEIDITQVAMKGGDFDEHSLQEIADTDELNRAVVDECIRYGADRKHWLLFSSGIKHGYKLEKLFNARGIPAIMLTGKDSMAFREEKEAEFRAGKYRLLINNGLYGRGWNFPALDMIAWARATQSTSLWIQGCVRGTRTFPGKDDCIARGQRVLTDVGLIPIEQVTREMKVWDGLDFVSHSGAVCRGIKRTITYTGLTATPDHRVKTKEGWKTLWQSLVEQAPICVTEADGSPIREIDNYFRNTRASKRAAGEGFCSHSMRVVREDILARLYKLTGWISRLPKMRKKAVQAEDSSPMVIRKMLFRHVSLHERARQILLQLWCKGYKVLIRKSVENGGLDSRELGASERFADRQDRQQRPLRTWKHSLLYRKSAGVSHTTPAVEHKIQPIPRKVSGDTIRRQHSTQSVWKRVFGRAGSRAILPAIIQTEREVWDILNCGPRHCFTCEGLLVHNCLILDFAGNTRRLGAVNAPIIPQPRRKGDKEKGEAPVKECPECHSYIHTRTMVCPDCGYQFPPPQTIKKTAAEDEIMKGGDVPKVTKEIGVLGITYKKGMSKKGNAYLRITYFAGTKSFHEFQFFGSSNPIAKRDTARWWEFRGGQEPIPETVEDALLRAPNELRTPDIVRVEFGGKYPQVLGCDYNDDSEDEPF